MRIVADISRTVSEYARAMIFAGGDGVYLFLYSKSDDGPSDADYWFDTVDDAQAAAHSDFQIKPSDWVEIPDPLDGCQHDWIANVRVKRDSNDDPLHGQFEMVADP